MIFTIGDNIKKILDGHINDAIYKIIYIEIINGGNWHDGYTTTIFATIEQTNVDPDSNNSDKYCIQYTNNMCQINNTYAIKVE